MRRAIPNISYVWLGKCCLQFCKNLQKYNGVNYRKFKAKQRDFFTDYHFETCGSNIVSIGKHTVLQIVYDFSLQI